MQEISIIFRKFFIDQMNRDHLLSQSFPITKEMWNRWGILGKDTQTY